MLLICYPLLSSTNPQSNGQSLIKSSFSRNPACQRERKIIGSESDVDMKTRMTAQKDNVYASVVCDNGKGLKDINTQGVKLM